MPDKAMRQFSTTGKSLRFYGIVSRAEKKNISLYRNSDLRYQSNQPVPHEGTYHGRHDALVRVAMDAAASGAFAPDENAAAYGEVVWSWRRDPGATLAVSPAGNGGKKGRFPGESTYKP
jgi:hypothetical protein